MKLLTALPLLAFLLLRTSLLLLASNCFYWHRRLSIIVSAVAAIVVSVSGPPAVVGFPAVAVHSCLPCCCWLSCNSPVAGMHAVAGFPLVVGVLLLVHMLLFCVPAVEGGGCVSTADVADVSIVAALFLPTNPPPLPAPTFLSLLRTQQFKQIWHDKFRSLAKQ
jgi:hypothetical protein